jgi:hypothetical protein
MAGAQGKDGHKPQQMEVMSAGGRSRWERDIRIFACFPEGVCRHRNEELVRSAGGGAHGPLDEESLIGARYGGGAALPFPGCAGDLLLKAKSVCVNAMTKAVTAGSATGRSCGTSD